jgi:hypothetical protein
VIKIYTNFFFENQNLILKYSDNAFKINLEITNFQKMLFYTYFCISDQQQRVSVSLKYGAGYAKANITFKLNFF